MRILLLGPVHREKEFLRQKENHPFLKGQGQQSWVEAFEELGHDVSVFRYTDSFVIPNQLRVFASEFFENLIPRWYARYGRFKDAYYFVSLENTIRNQKLATLAKRVKPDILIISGGVSSIYPQTVRSIKNIHQTKVLLFSGINPLTSSTSVERIMIKKSIVDIVVDNDRGYAKSWEKLGAKKTIVLPISSVDPKLHKKVILTKREQKEYGCDVCFVGSLTKDRQEKLVQLRKFNIKIWGDLVPTVGLMSELKEYYHGAAFAEKMVKIFNAAKIVLNFQPQDMTHGGNMRTFEIPGCGAFQLTDRIDNKWFRDGIEYVKFRDIEDLKTKIGYYLQHESERKKISQAGYERARKEHTYQHHFYSLFSSL